MGLFFQKNDGGKHSVSNDSDKINSQQISDNMESVYGKITKYISEYGNNFWVISVKAPDKTKEKGYKNITCVGIISDVPINTTCEFFGKFELNKYNRKVYRFKSYRIVDPESSTDIVQYLYNQIDMIDLITAQKIYNKFKEDTIFVLDNAPERLLNIKGIGEAKIRSITKSWKKYRESMDIHITLQKEGIPLSIIESLKKNAKNKHKTIKEYIIQDSYDLIYVNDDDEYLYRINQQNESIDDENEKKRPLSFYDIEKIYKIIAPEEYEKNKLNYKRIEAGIYTYLKDINFETGNVYEPYDNLLLDKIADKKYLNLNMIDVAQVIAEKYMTENKHLKIDFKYNENNQNLLSYIIYTLKDYTNECNLAQSLIQLQSSNLSFIKYDKDKIDSRYNENQKNAIIAALENSVSVITGGPGTGKTTIINEIINICEYEKYKQVLLLAPTAKAAKKMHEVTGHASSTVHSIIFCKKDELYSADIIIVDESSMLDNTIASKLTSMMKPHQKLILVGDTNQLPSVDIGNVLQDIIDSNIFPVTKLIQIYRQQHGNDIISVANNINKGIVPNLNNLNDIIFIDINNTQIDEFVILEQILNKIKDHLSDEDDLIKEIQILSPIKKNKSGTFEINQFMQKYLNDINLQKYNEWIDEYGYHDTKFSIQKGNITFNFNDRVINTRNDYDKMVFNGEIGIIKGIVKNFSRKSKSNNNSVSDYKVMVYFIGHPEDELIEFKYSELDSLQLAYSMTVHKSQGSEYEYVILFLDRHHWRMLERNLLYTAITRTKNKLFIIGEKIAINQAVYTVNSNKRLTLLKERLMKEVNKTYI